MTWRTSSGKYLVDPAFEPDVSLFVDALTILKAISRFWVQVEVDIGMLEDHPMRRPTR